MSVAPAASRLLISLCLLLVDHVDTSVVAFTEEGLRSC
jgi:hypothetical protein